MSVAAVFLAALAALILSAIVGASSKSERVTGICVGVTVVSALIVVGCVCAGLWEAWAPWDVQLEKK